MNTILILDTETTGLIEPIQPIEMAWLDISFPNLQVLDSFERRYKPTKAIEYGAMATSHILDSDLIDKHSYLEAIFDIPVDVEYIIGHNIDYDWKVLNKPNIKRICTKALAQWLWPTLSSHSQSALLYFIYGEEARDWLKEAHSALCDIYNNKRLLQHILFTIDPDYKKNITIEKLYELSENARIPTIVSFGKFKGQPFTAMDSSYVNWWLNKSDNKPDEYQLKALRLAGFKV